MYETQSLERTLTRYEQRNDRLDFLLDVLSNISLTHPDSKKAVEIIYREFTAPYEGGGTLDNLEKKINAYDEAYKFIIESLAQRGHFDRALEIAQKYAISLKQRTMFSRYYGQEPIEVVREAWGNGYAKKPEKIVEAMKFAGYSDEEIKGGMIYLTPPMSRGNKPTQEEMMYASNIFRILSEHEALLAGSWSGGRDTHFEFSSEGVNFHFYKPLSSNEAYTELGRYLLKEGLDKHLIVRVGSIPCVSRETLENQKERLKKIAPIELLAKSVVGSNIIYEVDKLWETPNAPHVPTWADTLKIIGLMLCHGIDQHEAEIGEENN